MADNSTNKQSWWNSIPTTIKELSGFILAIVALIAALKTIGCFDPTSTGIKPDTNDSSSDKAPIEEVNHTIDKITPSKKYNKILKITAPYPYIYDTSCNNCPNIKFTIPNNGFCDACGSSTLNIVNVHTQDGKLSKCDFTHLYNNSSFQFQNQNGKWFILKVVDLNAPNKTTNIQIKEIATGSYPNNRSGNYCSDFDDSLSKCGQGCTAGPY